MSFAAGQASQAVTLAVLKHPFGGIRIFALALPSPTGATFGAKSSANVSILPRGVLADFGGDGRSTLGVFGPYGIGGNERFDLHAAGGDVVTAFGGPKDVPVVGDFDGDGKANFGVYGPYGTSGANRYAVVFSNGTPTFTDGIVVNFGQPSDLALTGSYFLWNARPSKP